MSLKAVIFDFDGTLTQPGSIDFAAIREKTRCPPEMFLLDYFQTLSPEESMIAHTILEEMEYKAACISREEDGAQDILSFLMNREIPFFIISRNCYKSIVRALQNFQTITTGHFGKIISRDDPFPLKPDPESIFHIADLLEITCDEILIVGDHIHDIQAGNAAGCRTAYKMTGRENDHMVKAEFRIYQLNELKNIIIATNS
ncbi:MAG: HAD family hydrolase [Spirochaetales bacterium]|nr:HAD family hydrolase [Spirochaetales bacterium]